MQVIHTWNPLILSTDRKVADIEPGLTPAEVIERCGLSFVRPYYLLVNGEPVGRAEWGTRRLDRDDVCHFVELPGGEYIAMAVYKLAAWMVAYGGASLKTAMFVAKGVAFVAQTVAVVGGMTLLNGFLAGSQPGQSGAIGAADEPFSVSSEGNRARIGQPFAEQFGRLKIYPDLGSRPWTWYETEANQLKANCRQVLFFEGIIGVGQYDVESVWVGDTPADDIDRFYYEILGPSDSSTLWGIKGKSTNSNLSGQMLNRAADDWTPLVCAVNPPGTLINAIEWDVTFPGGLYYVASYGTIGAAVYLRAYARLIGDDGAALGEWVQLSVTSAALGSGDPEDVIKLWAHDAQPLATTMVAPVPSGVGRYEFRIGGIDPNFGDTSACTRCYLGSVRGRYCGAPVPDYGDCTRIRIKCVAGEQVSGDVANRIAVICTRKLYPVGAVGFGGTLAATRSIVDAVAYMVTAENGGQQADSLLDFASLYALRGELETAGYYFDHRFQSRSSVMEACATAARCGLCVPYMPGLFMLIRDVAHEACSMKFTADDYTDGSFTITHSICTADSPTGVEIHCIDADTWADAVIECYDEDGGDTNLAVVELTGCTSRQQGYEIGMYMYSDDKVNRSIVEFATGLQGHIPLPGARVMIDIPAADSWQRSGLIQTIDGTAITLSEPIDWGDETTGLLYLTGAAAALVGPYEVEMTAQEYVVTGTLPVGTPTVENDAGEAARYLFAFSATETTSMRVTRIQPDGQNSVRVSGTIYGALPYVDPGTVSPADESALLALASLVYRGVVSDAYAYQLDWSGTATEVRIEIDEGAGYSVAEDNYTDASYAFTVASATVISVRVTPYDGAVLESGDAIVETYAVPATVTGLALDGSIADGAYTLTWDAVAGTDVYRITFYDAAGNWIGQLTSSTNSRDVTFVETTGMIDAPHSTWYAHVASVIDNDAGKPDTLELTYDGWDPTGLTATAKAYSILLALTYTPTASFEAVEIWMAESNDRATAVKVGETGADVFLVTGLEHGGTYYFWIRVRLSGGAYTVWYPFGDEDGVECEITFTVADVGAITATPFEDGVTFSWDAVASDYFAGYQYRSGVGWQAGTVYEAGDVILSSDTPIYGTGEEVPTGMGISRHVCVTEGTSGSSEPTWSIIGQTSDGTVTWDTMTRIWAASTAYALDYFLITLSDGMWECTTAGTTGGEMPDFSGYDVGDTVTDGTVTWTKVSGIWPWEQISGDITQIDIHLTERQREIQGSGQATIWIWVRAGNDFDDVSANVSVNGGLCINSQIDGGSWD